MGARQLLSPLCCEAFAMRQSLCMWREAGACLERHGEGLGTGLQLLAQLSPALNPIYPPL